MKNEKRNHSLMRKLVIGSLAAAVLSATNGCAELEHKVKNLPSQTLMPEQFDPITYDYLFTDTHYKTAAVQIHFASRDYTDVLCVLDMRNVEGVKPYIKPIGSPTLKALAYHEKGSPFYLYVTLEAEEQINHDPKKRTLIENTFSPELIKNRKIVVDAHQKELMQWGDLTYLLNETTQPNSQSYTIIFPEIISK